jgi:RNA polymerase sigma factor (sigma-70 family)
MELLRDYDRHGSETAFAELVRRHVALVYSAALRRVGVAAQAEEITQVVFVILARKAGTLRRDTILEGWLYETTRLTALSFMRGERRRQFREQEAYMQSTIQASADDPVWLQLSPLLDEAMARLNKKDRDAVMLRFFKEQSVREVAAALQVNEAVAQRRILRAVEKLRSFFNRRGIVVPAAVLTATISAHSVQAAPVTLAKTVTTVATVKGAAASASTLTLIHGALKLMAWSKSKTTIVGAIIILGIAATTTLMLHQAHASRKQTWIRSQLVNAGYATPEAALKTMLWGIDQGDADVVQASLTPQENINAQKVFQGQFADKIAGYKGRMSGVAGFQITEQPGSADNVTIDLIATDAAGQKHERKYWFKKTGREWKCDQIRPSFDLTK